VIELLGGIWTWAEKRGFVSGPNPARSVDTQRGQVKNRVLSRDELFALGKGLQEHDAKRPTAVAALRLVALTGLRREEACGLRWREIDWDGSCLRIEETKTGRSTRPIGRAAIEHLRSLARIHGEWIFPARDGTGSAELKKTIATIFDAAGLKDARSPIFAARSRALRLSSVTATRLSLN
jgi:integrase